jgi:hypothetical protein
VKQNVNQNLSDVQGCFQKDVQGCFQKGIEKLAASIYPGKQSKTKAHLLMEVISDSRLFNGESSEMLKQHSVAYVRKLFRLWRLLKAGDTSPVGGF